MVDTKKSTKKTVPNATAKAAPKKVKKISAEQFFNSKETRNAVFETLNINSPLELLFDVPRNLVDYRHFSHLKAINKDLSSNPQGESIKRNISLKVEGFSCYDFRGKQTNSPFPTKTVIHFSDYYKEKVSLQHWGEIGTLNLKIGAVNQYSGDFLINAGYFNVNNLTFIPSNRVKRLVPQYAGITNLFTPDTLLMIREYLVKNLFSAQKLKQAVAGHDNYKALSDSDEAEIETMITGLHSPIDQAHFDEAVLLAKRLSIKQALGDADHVKSRPANWRSAHAVQVAPTFKSGIKLTGDQVRAMNEILSDLESDRPMRRLLVGDVGCGKTLPFVGAAAAIHTDKAKIAILMPNSLLSSQVADVFSVHFPGTPVLVINDKNKKKFKHETKKELDDFLSSIGNPILVSTTSIIHIPHYVADFLVTDEQHKFSREQRESIVGEHTNVLEASATLIPRSMALITHAGMDVSLIKEMPVTKSIKTSITTSADEKRQIFQQIQSCVKNKEVSLIIYPLVDENGKSTSTTVLQGHALWSSKFPDQVAMIHGKMKPEEKIAAIESVKNGEKTILVASTVIEVGLDLPSAKVMIIDEPQRYGLSQLHQLRGRLARKGGDGYMYLNCPNTGKMAEKTMARLQTFCETNDGFILAEEDMEARGFGDLSQQSSEQSGSTTLLFRNLEIKPSEIELLIQVKNKPVQRP